MSMKLQSIYDRLLTHFGPQAWWPGESPFEVIVGAVLVQNTSWKNVERAIANLRDEGVMEPRGLYRLAQEELEELIRPAGYFRVKAKRLRNLLRHLIERYDGDLAAMFATDLTTLREELLAINGIGPETADSILLYAGNLPTFVVDNYTHRVLKRHGWIEFEADYHQVKEHFESRLETDAAVYNEFHALFVRVGHEHCSTRPKCEGCPLAEFLPEGGPLDLASSD
jgi:endonuclease-3 related protein